MVLIFLLSLVQKMNFLSTLPTAKIMGSNWAPHEWAPMQFTRRRRFLSKSDHQIICIFRKQVNELKTEYEYQAINPIIQITDPIYIVSTQ